MTRTETVLISPKKIEEAKKLRDELDSLIETAQILNNKQLMQSIRRSERDIQNDNSIQTRSKKELDDYFSR